MFKRSFLGMMGITKSLETESFLRTGYFDQNCKLMAGVLVNEDIFNEKTPKLKNRFPKNLDQISEIFYHDERVMNVVKFYWINRNISDKLFRLLKVTGEDMVDGIVLPSWPPLEELLKFRSEYPATEMFLSVHREDPDNAEYYDQSLEKLERYMKEDAIDGVLLEGNYYHFPEIDSLYIKDCLEYLTNHYKILSVGIDEIMNMRELYKLRSILKLFPDAGVVMESGLRTSDDFLELNTTKKYIQEVMTN